jgi:hypothetical protein
MTLLALGSVQRRLKQRRAARGSSGPITALAGLMFDRVSEISTDDAGGEVR